MPIDPLPSSGLLPHPTHFYGVAVRLVRRKTQLMHLLQIWRGGVDEGVRLRLATAAHGPPWYHAAPRLPPVPRIMLCGHSREHQIPLGHNTGVKYRCLCAHQLIRGTLRLLRHGRPFLCASGKIMNGEWFPGSSRARPEVCVGLLTLPHTI